MTRGSYIKALSLIIWGYVFIYLDLNVGVLDILPDWLGYVFIFNAIDNIYESRSYVLPTKGPCMLLATWNGLLWMSFLTFY